MSPRSGAPAAPTLGRSPWTRLGGGLALLTGITLVLWWSGQALPGPNSIDPPGLEQWFSRDPIVAAFALVRLVGLALTGWAAVTGALGLVVHRSRRLRRVRHLRTFVDRLCFPTVRRLVHGVAGATLAATLFTPSLAGADPAPAGPVAEATRAAVAASTPGGIAVMMATDAPSPARPMTDPGASTTGGETARRAEPGVDGHGTPGADGEVAVMVSAAAPPGAARPQASPPATTDAGRSGSMSPQGAGGLAVDTEGDVVTDPAGAPAPGPADRLTEPSLGRPTPPPATGRPAAPTVAGERASSPSGAGRTLASAASPRADQAVGGVPHRAALIALDQPVTASLAGLGDPEDAPSPSGAVGAVAEAAGDRWVIERGQHLWHVAETTLAARRGRPADDAAVAAYLTRLIDANRDRLVVPSNPDLVHAGQELILPSG